MKSRNISWEIVLAGLAFSFIAIYLIGSNSSSGTYATAVGQAPEPSLPSAIVIDLKNLENLKSLENLKNLKNLENLRNLEQLAAGAVVHKIDSQTIEQSLRKFEKELQEIENADFNIRLQDRKVYISKKYDVGVGTWKETAPGEYIYRQTFSTEGMETLKLQLGFGNVNVVGSDKSQAELTLRTTGDIASAQQLSRLLSVKRHNVNGRTEWMIASSEDKVEGNALNLEATLEVPKSLNLSMVTSAGHITASNLSGTNEFLSEGGHITLQSVDGNTKAQTQGGHIHGDEISGKMALHTKGGHIQLNQVGGSLEAITGGGHINASVVKADGPMHFETSAGNIQVTLPLSIKADLRAHGSHISLADPFNFEGTKSTKSLSGTLNGGGHTVVIDSGYGKITIRPND